MLLHSGGSVRGVSWAPWPPRPHPPPALMLKASFQPIASVNCQGLNWKREAQKCGSVFTTLPWSSQLPEKPEVRKRRKYICPQGGTLTDNHIFVLLCFSSTSRLHQETMCVWNNQLHLFPRADFEPRVSNYRFLSTKYKCHVAEAQRQRPRWWRGGGDRWGGDMGTHGVSPQTLQDYRHTDGKGHQSGKKRERRRRHLQGGTLFPHGTYWEALEKCWPWYKSIFAVNNGI